MMKQQQRHHGKFKESLALNLRQQQPGKSEWQLLGVAALRTHRQCWRKNAFKLKHRQATTTKNKNKWLWLKWNKNHSHYINDNKYPQSSATAQAALLGASIAATVYCRAPDDAATSTLQRQQNIINDTFTHSLLGSCDCLVSSLCILFFCFAYCESKLKILSEEQAAHNSILPHVFHKDAIVGKPFVANLNSVADMMLARSALASLSIPKLLWIIVLSYVVVKLRREWCWGRGCWQAVREAITQIVNAQWTWSIGTLLVPSKVNNNNNPALMVQCVRHGTNKRWARDSCAQ